MNQQNIFVFFSDAFLFQGETLDNLHIMPHELVFGWVNKQGRNQIPGHPNHVGFTSLNGIKWNNTSNDEELEMRIRFIGLAKTPFIFDNTNQLKHGFTAYGVGSGTTFHTGEEDIFHGDRLMWQVVPRPITGSMALAGGQFGDSGPGSRQGNPRTGTPRGKLRMRVNPSRYNDMKPSLNAAVTAMLATKSNNGISDVPFETLLNHNATERLTPAQEYAMALLLTDVTTIVRGVALLKVLVPGFQNMSEVQLCDAIGHFKTDPTQRDTVNGLIDGLYMGCRATKGPGVTAFDQFKSQNEQGFATNGTKTLARRADTISRHAVIATSLGNYQAIAFARAVHCVARRRFATALCYSRPGQRLDLLLGHFLESY